MHGVDYSFTINVPTIISGCAFAWGLFGRVQKIAAQLNKIPNLERRLRRIEFRLKIEPSSIEADDVSESVLV